MFEFLAEKAKTVFKKQNKENNTSITKYKTEGTRGCKKILEKVKMNSSRGISANVEIFDGVNTKYVIHITDNTFSNMLYEKISNDANFLTTIPREFGEMTFIGNNKKRQIVLIEYGGTTEHFDYILSNLKKYVSWFCDSFGTDASKIYVNYENLIEEFMKSEDFFKSLMLSAQLTEYKLDKNSLINIINALLKRCRISWVNRTITYSDMNHNIKNITNEFYDYISRGMYSSRLQSDFLNINNLPVYLYVNIFKFATDENCFSDLMEFFDSSKIEKYEQFLDEEEFVFDEKRFLQSIKLVSETDTFVKYESGYSPTRGEKDIWLEIKDARQNDKIKSVLNELREKELLVPKVKFYGSVESETCFISYKIDTRRCSLSQRQSIFPNNISSIVYGIYSTFVVNSAIVKKLEFSKDTNLCDVLDGSVIKDNIILNDISLMSFDDNPDNIKFEYPLAMLQAIKKWVEINNVDVSEIYKKGFAKLLSPELVEDAIQYVQTGKYVSKGMIKKAKDILPKEYENKIVFLEELSSVDLRVLERTTLFEVLKGNAIAEEVNTISKNFRDRIAYTRDSMKDLEKVSLDECLKNLMQVKGQELYLTEKTLKNLYVDVEQKIKDNFLVPEKFVISKDFTSDGKYQIIGIVWNKSKLYKLTQYIQSGKVGVKSVYNIIAQLLNIYALFGVSLSENQMEYILINDKLEVVLDCTQVLTYREFQNNRLALVNYYNILVSALQKYFPTLPSFEYARLVGSKNKDNLEQVLNFYDAIERIECCPEHGEYYFKGEMCPTCEEIYELKTYIPDGEEVYSDEVNMFFSFEDGEIFSPLSREYIKQVKLGLVNDLYEPFAAFEPYSILVSSRDNITENDIEGLSYGKYDFKDIVRMESFKQVQRLKFVLLAYKKVLPHILDQSFICNDKRIFTTMFMDMNNKGEIIIPNIILLDSETILSDDQQLKALKQEETKKLFAEFLSEYITSDEYLVNEIDKKNPLVIKIVEEVKQGIFEQSSIMDYIKTRNAFCKAHKLYFDSEEVICPECKKDGIKIDDIIIEGKGYFDNLSSGVPMYEGGEANLYPYPDFQVQKIFNDKVDIGFKSKIIGKALEKAKLLEEFNRKHDFVKFVYINKVMYSYENNVLELRGYVENLIESSHKISAFKDKEFVNGSGYTRRDIVNLLISACRGIEFLHSIGGYIGDLNGGNIVVKDNVVYIIDIDGMSFDDVRNNVYTDLYIYPPSAKSKNITAADDWYSFAVQTFYYLTYSHPFRGVCDNPRVPVNEMDRMSQGFSVLGNHGIKVPNISIGWTFMPKRMTDFFLETFEGNKRESMTPVLEMFLKQIEAGELAFNSVKRDRKVKCSLTDELYIDINNKLVFKEAEVLSLTGKYEMSICGKYFVIRKSNSTILFDGDTGESIAFNKGYGDRIAYVNNNKIYYTSSDSRTLYSDEVGEDGAIVTQGCVTSFDSIMSVAIDEDNTSYIVVNDANKGEFCIFYNGECITRVPQQQFGYIRKISVLQDKISNKWLVLFAEDKKAEGIVYDKKNGNSPKKITISDSVSNSICFYSNVIYYVKKGKICTYGIASEKMANIVCNVANESSRIERVGNKFVVNNKDETYVYQKS